MNSMSLREMARALGGEVRKTSSGLAHVIAPGPAFRSRSLAFRHPVQRRARRLCGEQLRERRLAHLPGSCPFAAGNDDKPTGKREIVAIRLFCREEERSEPRLATSLIAAVPAIHWRCGKKPAIRAAPSSKHIFAGAGSSSPTISQAESFDTTLIVRSALASASRA